LISRINAGVHFLNHLGHGSETGAMKLSTSELTSDLTNTDLCFVYSQTCLAGHFDSYECWAETANIKTDHAAFAVIMNAREGWGEFDSTDGASQRFDREFWDAVFDPVEDKPEIGRANQDSKEDNLYRISDDYMRWIYYELNVFGDPTVALTSISGLRVTPGSGLNPAGQPGGPFSPDSTVYTIENKSDFGINYEITHTSPWIDVSPAMGFLSGGNTIQVTVSLNQNAAALSDGTYTDTISIVNTTTHEGDSHRVVTITVGVPSVVYDFPLDSDPGWSRAGQWEFGQPAGLGGTAHGRPDPTSGATGLNVFGVNLNGDYDSIVGGPWYLRFGPIDMTSVSEASLHFQRWLNSDYQNYAFATVEVSADGSEWDLLWENGGDTYTDESWHAVSYPMPTADHQPWVYLRWGYETRGGVWAYSGWNIDDVRIRGLAPTQPAGGACCLTDGSCLVVKEADCTGTFLGAGVFCLADTCEPSVCPGDCNCDDAINWRDIDYFVAGMNDNQSAWADLFAPSAPACGFANCDVNADGTVNWRDIDGLVGLMNTTCP
jgi:hypothetical protein